MKVKILAIAAIVFASFAATSCSTLREPETPASNPSKEFVEQRTEIIAKSLLADGKASTMEEARAMAARIVQDEIRQQRAADRDNATRDNTYNPNGSIISPRE